MDLCAASGRQRLRAHAGIRKLVDPVITLSPLELLVLIAIHLLDIRTILLDKIRHINICTGLIEIGCCTLCIDHIRVLVTGDHQCHILPAIPLRGDRIGHLQRHTCCLCDRGSHRIVPVRILTIGIVIGEGNRRLIG